MSPADVAKARASGVSFVCAHCPRYWEGRERGMPDAQCTTLVACGGPLSGMVFPAYAGDPLAIDRLCFVCGSPADFGLRPAGQDTVAGCCTRHMALLERIEPKTPALHVPKGLPEIRGDRGQVSLGQALAPPRKLLSDLLKGPPK